MQIFAIHGIEDITADKLCYRNIIDKNAFVDFVKLQKSNIVNLNDALRYNEGTVISIDDSTLASYNAALYLKENGIPGIWFVNPLNIMNGTNYSAALLNTLLDLIETGVFKTKNDVYKCATIQHKRKIRKMIKEKLKNETINESERIQTVTDLGTENGISCIGLPLFSTPVSINHLNNIYGSCVEIANHGWEHNFTETMTYSENCNNYQKARDWFINNNYLTNNYYALPYGMYTDNLKQFPEKIILLLLDSRFNPGYVKPNIINRINLVL
ncbi:MAG: polysaccharide deacetylase family protein [Bacteroidetes bacterium]|nr:polysaccharide deacetylase family protein [Bacteroidota bacterium]